MAYTNDLRVWQNGTWSYPSEINVNDGSGTWAHASHVYVRKGNAWVQSWPRIEGTVTAFTPEWVFTAQSGTSTRVYYANLTNNQWTYISIPNFESGDTVHNVYNLSTGATYGTIISGGTADGYSGKLIYLGNYPNTILAANPTAPTVYPGYDYDSPVTTFHAWEQNIFGNVVLNLGFADGSMMYISSAYNGQQVQFSNTSSTNYSNPSPTRFRILGSTPYAFDEYNIDNPLRMVGENGNILASANNSGIATWTKLSAYAGTNFTGTMTRYGPTPVHYYCGTGGVILSYTGQRVSDYVTGSQYTDNVNKMVMFNPPSDSGWWVLNGYDNVMGVAVGDNGFFSILYAPIQGGAPGPDRWVKRTILNTQGQAITANIVGIVVNIRYAGINEYLELVLLTDTGTLYRNIDNDLLTYYTFTHPDVDSWVAGDHW